VFDDVLRKLRDLEHGVAVAIELELDDNGYLDRMCPSGECGATFKVMFEDWRDIVRDEEIFCPVCRRDAKSSEWNTLEQADYIKQAATAYLQDQLGQAIQSDARRFNRSQSRKSFIKMSMSYKSGHVFIPAPANAADIMTQRSACHECNCRYASLGAAFFCPSCGHNSVLDTFANSVGTVRRTLEALPAVRVAFIEAADKDVAQDAIRHILENGLVKLMSSFQRYAEACFNKLPDAGSVNIRRNLFQSLANSDAIWREATGTGYSDILGKEEYAMLSLYFQHRHVLVHLEGIVDQQYIDRSNDHRFNVGQRLVVTEANVSELADVIERLAAELNKRT
jgi:hypothetical protein